MNVCEKVGTLMRGGDTFAGLDFGHASVKAVVLTSRGGAVEVADSVYLDRAAEGFVDEEEFGRHLGAWLAEKGLSGLETVIGIPQDLTTVQIMDFPPNSNTALESMVSFQIRQLGDLSEENFASDYEVMPASPERPVPVLVGVCLESVIDRRTQQYTAAGIRVMDLAMNGIAAVNACFALRPECVAEDRPQLILDIGPEATTLVVWAGGRVLFVGVLMIGAESFQSAPSADESTGAAQQVRRAGTAPRLKRGDALGALASAADSLVTEVRSGLDQWRDQDERGGDAAAMPTRIFLCGGGASINGLPRLLHEAFGCEVDVLRPPVRAADGDRAPQFVVAYGLALQAAGLAPLSISLAPAKTRRLAKRRRRIPVLGAAVGLWVLFLTVAFFGRHVTLRRELTALKDRHAQLELCDTAISELSRTLDRIQAVERIQIPIVEHGNRAHRFSTAIEKLGNARGPNDWFIYIGDAHSFEQGKAPLENQDRPGAGARSQHSPFQPAAARPRQDRRPNARTARHGVTVTNMTPLRGMVAFGYARLRPDAEPLEPVRRIVGTLNDAEFFAGVDLIHAGELRGREDISRQWQQYLYSARRHGNDAEGPRFRAFSIDLPFAETVLQGPSDDDMPGGHR